MRVLHVTQNFIPHFGGVEKHIFELSRRLVDRGFEIEVLCGNTSGLKSTETIEGIKVKRLYTLSIPSPYDIGRIQPTMTLEIYRSKADLIHAHAYGYFPTYASLSSKKPLIITTHSDPTARIYPFYDALRMIPVKAADRVVATTKKECAFLIKKGVSPGRISVIPNGVTLPREDKTRIINRKDNLILCLARLDIRQKGQDVLIKALKYVKKKMPEVKLEIVGKGRDFACLQALIERGGMMDSITIENHVDDTMKEVKFRKSSLLCISPRTESFGIVYLEAMSFGLPIVTTDVGGVSEVVGNAAILVPKEDPISLSNAILQVMCNKETSKNLGKNGLRRARLYDWDKIVDKYVELYTNLVI